MECVCAINVDYDDPVDLCFRTDPTARKNYRCGECRREIARGEKYCREKTLYNGRFEVNKTCLDCASIRDAFCCTWTWGDVLEDIRNMVFDSSGKVPESCIEKLTPRALVYICELINECWAWEDGRV